MAVAMLQKEEIKSMAKIATIQISKAKSSASYGRLIFLKISRPNSMQVMCNLITMTF